MESEVMDGGRPRLPLEVVLTAIGACPEGRSWATPYGTDYARAWDECPNGEWLLYMATICCVDAWVIAGATIRAVRELERELISHGDLEMRRWLEQAQDLADREDLVDLTSMGWELVGEFEQDGIREWHQLVMARLGRTLAYLSHPDRSYRVRHAVEEFHWLFEELMIGEGPDVYRRIADRVRDELTFDRVLEAYRASGIMNP